MYVIFQRRLATSPSSTHLEKSIPRIAVAFAPSWRNGSRTKFENIPLFNALGNLPKRQLFCIFVENNND